MVAKNVMGRLKVIAAGQTATESHWSVHYNKTFEAIRDDPGQLLLSPGFLARVNPYSGSTTLISLGGPAHPVRIGGLRIVVIAGPCAVESRQQTLECAACVRESGAGVFDR